jgi:hypothetical protein
MLIIGNAGHHRLQSIVVFAGNARPARYVHQLNQGWGVVR